MLKLGPRWRISTLSRLTTSGLGLTVAFSLLLAACGSPDPTVARTARPTPTTAAATVAPADDREPWKIEWDELKVAAREEGKIVVIGGSAAIRYRPMFKYFGDKFGIKVVSAGGNSRDLVDRVLAERSVGRYTIDFFISGLTTSTERLIPNGVLQPIDPLLLLPEVRDLNNWLDNRRVYVDPEKKYIISYAASAGNVLLAATLNTDNVSADEARTVHSVWDYLKTDWKIISTPATDPGATGFYNRQWWHPDAGPAFVEAWFRHPNITWRSDARTIEIGLVKGTWDASIMALTVTGGKAELVAAGAPIIEIEEIPGVIENWTDAVVLSGTQSANIMSAVDKPVHPNAQKLLVNWWLSHEGQTQRHIMSERRTDPSQSLRTDVTEMGNTIPANRRIEGVRYTFLEDTPGYDPVQGLADVKRLWVEIHG